MIPSQPAAQGQTMPRTNHDFYAIVATIFGIASCITFLAFNYLDNRELKHIESERDYWIREYRKALDRERHTYDKYAITDAKNWRCQQDLNYYKLSLDTHLDTRDALYVRLIKAERPLAECQKDLTEARTKLEKWRVAGCE